MSNSYSVTASQVGSYFVQQYYQMLQQQPDFVHQFYVDWSSMVRVDGESTETASSIFEIHTILKSLHITGIEVKTINSLESWSEGVMVVVSGSVKSKNFSGWRKFVQTFFLAPQEKGYFVKNDIFHFVSDEVVHLNPPPVVNENKVDFQPISSTPPELLVAEDALEIEARENLNSINIEGDDQDDYYNSQENQHLQQEDHDSEAYEEEAEEEEEEDEEEEEPASLVQNPVNYSQEPMHQNPPEYVQEPIHQNQVEYVQEPTPAVEEPAAEPVKFTYASILQSKGKPQPSGSAQTSVSKSVMPAPEWYQIPEPVVQPPPAPYVPETTSPAAEESFTNEEGNSKSVYVRNLPTTVTSQEILLEFKNFGRIKQDGVFLKNRKDVGVCFAFVEFEDVESVQKAIEASPIQLAGRQVYVEERRANSSSSSRGGRGGRGGRGRGSYNDASRGRYGGGSYARGGYQDGRGNGFRNV